MDPIRYLFSLEKLGIKFGLDNIRTICRALGDPERAYPVVTIAGTNGKGSVTAMTAAALDAAGLRTARYTSPHLDRLEERFVVAGRPVGTATLVEVAGHVQAVVGGLIEAGALTGQPTFFEVTTAIALELFKRAGIDVAVLEVGLGGRLDATNVADPIAVAITSIDLDHERFLGGTLASIAAEKAGVIRPGIPVVVGERKPEPAEVLRRASADAGAHFIDAWEGASVDATLDAKDTHVEIRTQTAAYGPLTLALRGRHQAANALVAVRLLEVLRAAGLTRLSGAAIETGLREARWPGRLEYIDAEGARVLFDAAHNPAGAAVLTSYLEEIHPGGVPIVFGAMRDKNARGMLDTLRSAATSFVFTRPHNDRAQDPLELAAVARDLGVACPVRLEPDPQTALELASEGGGLVCVTGSIFLVGELRGILLGRHAP